MLIVWSFVQVLAGLLISFSQVFRAGPIVIEPQWWSLILASFGLALFMKVSSLRSKAWNRFFLGFIAGLVYFLITLYWIFIALREFGGINWFVSSLITLLLCAYCASFMGLWSLFSGFRIVREKPLFVRITIWASLWAGLEAVREHLFTGFIWGEISHSFAFFPWIGRTAEFWGAHGLLFIWIFFLSCLLHIDEWWPSKLKRVGIAGFVLIFVGFCVLSSVERKEETQSLRVALIQPNVDQGVKWDAGRAREHMASLLEMTSQANDQNVDLVVWPETSYPFPVGPEQKQLPFYSSTPVIVGAVVMDRKLNRNTALWVRGDKIIDRFSKSHLVPFGEYVPLEGILPFGKLVANAGRFVPGSKDQDPFVMQKGSNAIRMGPLICYEDIFSARSSRLAQKGVNLLVNITNDAWYGKSSALRQHAAMARMQVFQTRLPMLRSTNTGLSSVMSTTDWESIETEERELMIAEIEVPVLPQPSFFVASYPLMQWIWFLFFGISLLWKPKMQTKRIFFPPSED